MAVVKLKYKKLLLWCLVLIHISLIFSFSLQSATASTAISKGITEKVKSTEKFEEEFKNEKNADGRPRFKEFTAHKLAERESLKFEAIIRKTAHILLFFILGVLINFLVMTYGFKGFVVTILSLLYSGTVAFFDETIQLFTSGRAGLLSDVFIDLLGAALASIFFLIGGLIYEKTKNRRIKMDN